MSQTRAVIRKHQQAAGELTAEVPHQPDRTSEKPPERADRVDQRETARCGGPAQELARMAQNGRSCRRFRLPPA